MAKPIAAVAIDVFCPGAYRAPAWPEELGSPPDFLEDYSHESGFAYVVLQPMLFRGHGPEADSFPVSMCEDPRAWFADKKELGTDDLAVADKVLLGALTAEIAPVPVALPPGTRITLELYADGAAEPVWVSGERIVGANDPASPFALASSLWPEFARINFAHPLARTFAELDVPQQEEVYVWLGAAVVDLKRTKDGALGLEMPRKVLSAAQRQALVLFDRETLPQLPAEMRSHLIKDGRGRQMYDVLLNDQEQGEHILLLSAPRFKIVASEAFRLRIENEIRAGVPAGMDHISYLHVWWQTMCGQAQNTAGDAERLVAWTDPHADSELAGALGRYFGFGERLRWRAPPFDGASDDNQVLMAPVLAGGPGGYIETNAASLCELVFRVPTALLGDKPESVRARLSIARLVHDDADTADPADGLGPHLARIAHEASEWASARLCQAQVERDTIGEDGKAIADAHGIVMVQPRASQCVALENRPHKYAVPASLIDLADDSPRHDIGEAEDGLVAIRAPRRALLPEECLGFDLLKPGATQWRIQGELRTARVATGVAADQAQVYEFLAQRLSTAPVAQSASGQPASEAGRFGALLPVLLRNGGTYGAELWLANVADAFPLDGRLLDADGPDSDLRLFVLDEAPGSGIGQALAGASGGAVACDIVISVLPAHADAIAAMGSMPFNVLVGAGPGAPWVALKQGALSRVGRSADRWLERFHVTPEVDGREPGEDHPLQRHLQNFNKLRVYARGETAELVPITYPDAALPLIRAAPGQYAAALPWSSGWPREDRGFSYFVGHLYTQEMATQRPEAAQPAEEQTPAMVVQAAREAKHDRKPEAIRYARYQRANGAETIVGYLEHQYSYRLPIVHRELVADARLASDVRNLAALIAREQGQSGIAIGEEKAGPRAALLEFSLDDDNALLITAQSGYFQSAFAAQQQALQGQNTSAAHNVEILRGLYEAACDFLHALNNDGATLVAHLLRFDNRLPRPAPAPDVQVSLPARLHRFGVGTLALRQGEGAGALLRAGLGVLAPPTFGEFVGVVERLRAAGTGQMFPPVRVDMASMEWRIDGVLGHAPDLRLEANVVRLALDLQRPENHVIDPEQAEGRMIAFSADTSIPAWIGERVDEVLHNARAELKALLQRPAKPGEGSSLYRRRDWLQAQPPQGDVIVEPAAPLVADQTEETKLESRAGRWQMVFGDYAPTVLVPPGAMTSSALVAELFYFPMAFVPLESHSALAGPNDTLAFTEYLLGMAGDLLNGAAPAELQLTPHDPATVAEEGAQALLRLRVLLANNDGIAHELHKLLRAVHNDPDLRASSAPLTMRALAAWDQAAARRDADLRALLARQPQLFASARAIGVAVFDPARFAPSLHSVQLWKRIDQGNARAADLAIDLDRFQVPPAEYGGAVLLDPLEAARYDTEFELPVNRYTLADGSDAHENVYDYPIELGATVRLSTRGGASGRTGEDFLESLHHFPVPDGAAGDPRGVELDAPHWNPHWRYATVQPDGTRRQHALYLLPSRRFPAVPVPVQMSATDASVAVNTTPVSIDADATGSEQEVFENRLRAALHALNGLPLVVRAEGGDPLAETPVWTFDATRQAFANYKEADGWYRIDTFLEHHYFMVEAGEAGESAFANELFEIEVQVNRAGLRQTGEAQPLAATRPAVSPLLNGFRRWQSRKGQGADAGPTLIPGDAMTVPQLVESIGYWLCSEAADPARVPLAERRARNDWPLLRPRDVVKPSEEPVRIKAHYKCPLPDVTVSNDTPPADPAVGPLSERIGSVAAVAMFTTKGTVKRGERAILRVTVLADPWSRCRVRLCQIRNRRDIDGDKPDIDPVFEMVSLMSAWSGYAHGELVLTAPGQHAPPATAIQRRLEVTAVPLREWMARRSGTPAPQLGPILRQRLESTVPGTGPFAGKPFWNSAEMQDPTRQVSAVLRQRLPDRHMAHDGTRMSALEQRDLTVPRHVFGIMASNSVDQELARVAPATITAGEPELEVCWLDKSSQAPVCRATWPIRFRDLKDAP